MSGRPVNIAEFRCRAIKARSAHAFFRAASRPCGLKVVEPSSGHLGKDAADETHSSETPIVFDIGIAREAQRLRRRPVFRPISIQRRAKVIHFGEAQTRVVAARAPESWPHSAARSSDGSFDLPPAA
jgi:hypothetical protein